jgi:hypothetical protein
MGADGFSFHEWQRGQRGENPAFFDVPGAPPPRPTPPEAAPRRERAIWETLFAPPPSEPRPAAPPPAAPKPAARPAWVRSTVDPAQFFELRGLFDYINKVKRDPSFRVPPGQYAIVPLLQIAAPSRDPTGALYEAAKFLRLPEGEVRRHRPEEAWHHVVEPFVRELERALDAVKPAEIPGFFRFDFAEDGSFGLAYYER